MTLTPVNNQGQWFMTGINGTNAPFSMGRRIFQPGNGPHFIGFDDNFTEPIVFKIFYDPYQDSPTEPYEFAGYVQCMQLKFRGTTPIPPQIYGGVLADRAPYVCGPENGYQFVDFMGPADARLRSITEPFYAYNGALLDGLTYFTDFKRHPLPNGSLFYPTVLSSDQSLCASLFGEVSTTLITAQDITPWLTDDRLIYAISVSLQQLANSEPYQIALAFLSGTGKELEGLQPSDIAGQVIGQYVLITLPNYENMSPRLCISTRTTNLGSFVDVHLFASDDIESLEADVTAQAFDRIYTFLGQNGIIDEDVMQVDPTPTPRGQGGFLANPFKLTSSDLCLELQYWTTAVARRVRETRSTPRIETLSTFTWSALFQYDEDTRSLALSTIREPAIVSGYDWVTPYLYCQQAINDQRLRNVSIDTSNFTKASMRRDNLGSGIKLQFIDRNGTNIS